MIVKVHRTQEGRKIIAICDKELIGKKIEEGNLQLDLSGSFYKGEEKGEEEARDLIVGDCIVNVVGKKSVNFGIKIRIIDGKNVIKIKNIPHAQAVV